MTITTLIYLRDLIVQDIARKEEAAEKTRRALYDAEDDESTNRSTLEALKGARELALHKVWEAQAALDEFNSTDWHC